MASLSAVDMTACTTSPGAARISSNAVFTFASVRRKFLERGLNASRGNWVRKAASMCRARLPVESERTYSIRAFAAGGGGGGADVTRSRAASGVARARDFLPAGVFDFFRRI